MDLKEKPTALVKHRPSVKNLVAVYVVGTDYNIGSFFDEAAMEKLIKIKESKKSKNRVSNTK